jgi:hypothetical protein
MTSGCAKQFTICVYFSKLVICPVVRLFPFPWKGDSASKLSSLSRDKESGLVKREWFTNIVRIFCTYFAFTSFDSEETQQKRNRIKQKRNETKQKIIMTVHQYDKWLCKTVHDLCLFLQTGNLPSSSCVSIRISHLLTVNVSNEGYYRNRSCALRYLRFYYSSCITYFVYLVQLNYLWTNFSCCLWRG